MTSTNHRAPAVSVGATSWLDYVGADPNLSVTIVRDHHKLALDPGSFAHTALYWPMHAGQIRCVNLANRADELDTLVDKAAKNREKRWLGAAYRAAADGFLKLLPSTAEGVTVPRGVRWSNNHLQIKMANMLGLSLPNGSRKLVGLFNKRPELTQDQADRLLVPMLDVIDNLLPRAEVAVWDTRRGREFQLRPGTNLADVRISIAGLTSKYTTEWTLAA